MLRDEKRVFFQSKVSERLLKDFREVQEKEGRTARSMIEEFMHSKIQEHNKRGEGNGWAKNI